MLSTMFKQLMGICALSPPLPYRRLKKVSKQLFLNHSQIKVFKNMCSWRKRRCYIKITIEGIKMQLLLKRREEPTGDFQAGIQEISKYLYCNQCSFLTKLRGGILLQILFTPWELQVQVFFSFPNLQSLKC